MIKLYIFARKAHRILVLIISALSLVMASTGVALRYPSFFLERFPSLDLSLLRFIHNKISTYFSIILVLMALTGLYMYFHVWLVRRRSQKQPPSQAV